MSDIPEDEFSPEELAQAQALADQVDHLVGKRSAPATDAAAERELVQSASMIHGVHHLPELAEARKASLIEEAMASATGADRADFAGEPNDMDRARAKRRLGPALGIVGVLVAAAAVLLIWRARPEERAALERPVATRMELLDIEQSRPSDALVGPISRDESGRAAERLQVLRDDRLAGYRSLRYRRLGGAR